MLALYFWACLTAEMWIFGNDILAEIFSVNLQGQH
jgi:hypothetical protein